MKKPAWAAAMLYADPLGLANTAGILKRLGCAELHLDVMDGAFVPAFGFSLQTVAALVAVTDFHVDIHLMAEHPERHIPACVETGCASITLPVESTPHIHRAVQQVKDAGLRAGIAINTGTPLTKLEYLLPQVDRVHVLLSDWGTMPQPITQAALDRVRILRENIRYHEYRVQISAEGPMQARDVASLSKTGVDTVVLDDASIFAPGDVEKSAVTFLEACEAEIQRL
jgi:ribulose-phosphate 3-epimerase